MQRLAVGGGGKIESWDANPPGTSSEPKSANYQNQLPIYGKWKFKSLPLTPRQPGPGKKVTPNDGKV